MSWKSDVEVLASVAPPSSTQQVLYLDSVANQWWSKKSDGTGYPIGSTDIYWYDVTKYGLKGDDSTDNLAAWNTLYASLPLFATVYFPPGTYRFSGEITMNRDIRLRVMGAGAGRSLIRLTTSATAHGFRQTVAGFYVDFWDLGFVAPTVTKTAGSMIRLEANNAECRVLRCEFNGAFNGVEFTGSGGNVSSIVDCNFQAPVANGSQILINGGGLNLYIHNVTTNCVGVAGTSGLQVNSSGAVQVTGSDFIGGANTLLINATGTISALVFANVFLDQASGSTMKITGASAVSRIKFIGGGITNGAAGTSAVEIAGSGTGTAIPDGIDFFNTDIYNTGFGGTTNGFLVTGCRGLQIIGCRISGQTNGINVTPYNSNGVTKVNVVDCTVGPTENFAANGTGILLNAGAVQYGSLIIQNNDVSGNTTAPITDSSTVSATTGQKIVAGNIGVPVGVTNINRQAIPIATTYVGGLVLPSNSLRVGSHFRVTLNFSNPATAATTTVLVKYGTLGTAGDATIHTAGAFTGTAAADVAKLVLDVHVDTLNAATGTVTVHGMLQRNLDAGVTGFHNVAGRPQTTTQTATLNTTTAANVLGVAITGAVAATTVLLNGEIEVVN